MKIQHQYNILVLGATGNVGREVINILSERNFPIKRLLLAASDKSIGKEMQFGNRKVIVTSPNQIDFSNIDIAFFCTNETLSKKYAALAAKHDCYIIDKSSYFRLNKDIPLAIPEIKSTFINNNSKIFANPNCVVIPLGIVLYVLNMISQIKRISVATYQSVSGAGSAAMEELYKQTKLKFTMQDDYPENFPKQIAFNLFPHIGDFLDNGETQEEDKIRRELCKILDKEIGISITCVRVPVFVSHSISLNVEFAQDVLQEDILANLSKCSGITVLDNKEYVTPVEVVKHDNIYVSRIRNENNRKNIFNMWICCDNIRKGAALNAVQIAEMLTSQKKGL